MVMNRKGNSDPAKTGPVPLDANVETAGAAISGRATTMPMASRMMVPTFMKVDR